MAYPPEYEAIHARYYDVSGNLRDGADLRFYRALAHETGGPVLELGCGTGRVLLPIDLGAERFRLVFSAFRPLQHLYSVEDQLRCLAAVRRHLAPGGLFAFDVFAPDLARCARAEEPEYEEERVADGDAEFITFTSLHRDVATQLMDVTHRHVRMRHGVVVEEAVERYRMRWYHRYELEHLLARAGFEVVAAYGDFDRKPFDRDAREMVFVARSCSSHRD